MATQWLSMTTRLSLVYVLLAGTSALPTEKNTANVLMHDNNQPPPPQNNPLASNDATPHQAPSPNIPSALTSDQRLASSQQQQPVSGSSLPASTPGSGSSVVQAPNTESTPNLGGIGSITGSAMPNPFTNHFVLDTANLDIDGDGCIAGDVELDLFKFHVATALVGSPDSLLRAHSIVHRTDINKDGRICWCDFISIYLHDKNQSNATQHTAPFVVILDKESGMFAKLDRDGDGMLKGPELNDLVMQFSLCIPEEQARLIVAAMTGLASKDGAVSIDEFARFLGMAPDHTTTTANQADVRSPPIPAPPSGGGAQPGAKSGISGVRLTSTTLSPGLSPTSADGSQDPSSDQ